MIRLFSLFWFFAITTAASSRSDGVLSGSVMSDSALVARLQHVLMTKRPMLYRRDVTPAVERWVVEDSEEACKESKPYVWLGDKADILKKGDVCYAVTLYYWNWQEEGFDEKYTARGLFLERTGELLVLYDGWRYCWQDISKMPDAGRLSLMPVSVRDSVLSAVSADALRKLLPRMYCADSKVVDIREATFEKKKYPWLGDDASDLHEPLPSDRYGIYYVVTLLGAGRCEHHCDGKPYCLEVYVAEKNEMPYKAVDPVNNRVYTLMDSRVLDEMELRLPTEDNGCRDWIRKQRAAIEYYRDMEYAR